MLYRVIGSMSGSSMDGLDLVYCTLTETAGDWSYEILESACIKFTDEWKSNLEGITNLSAKDLLLAHTAFGKWMGESIQSFISNRALEHKVHFVASHGHTVFHEPQDGMTFQLGDGAAIAAVLSLPVISDLRNMDVALGGQGAPIVPIGEQFLWPEYDCFLNLGGIANITKQTDSKYVAFDVCPANRVLNAICAPLNKEYDDGGGLARSGQLIPELLEELNALDYYKKEGPKSLANEFGLEVVLPIIQNHEASAEDKLHTFVQHIVHQIAQQAEGSKILVTGGGAFNTYLIEVLTSALEERGVELIVPEKDLIDSKEALVMALIGALRWREEENVLHTVTGSTRSSVGGALWMGRDF